MPQVCFVGVIAPQTPELEYVDQVRKVLSTAAKYIPKERLGATGYCEFSPFSIDEKLKHGSPDFARDVTFQKNSARVEGGRLASEDLGAKSIAASTEAMPIGQAVVPRKCLDGASEHLRRFRLLRFGDPDQHLPQRGAPAGSRAIRCSPGQCSSTRRA